MPIEGFDPKGFADNLAGQAAQVIPADLADIDKKFIASILHHYCLLAADALYKEEPATLNAQQACIITQFIGEWTFHKCVDLVRSGVPLEKRDAILQKVAFAVFEEARVVITNNVEQGEAIARVEQAVTTAYQSALDEMQRQNQLDASLAEKAMHESNIDKMAEQAQAQANQDAGSQAPARANTASSAQSTVQNETSKKLLRLAAIALLLKKMNKNVESILCKFDEKDRKAIVSYMQVSGLEEAFDMNTIKDYMHDFLLTIPSEAQAYSEKEARRKYTELAKSIPQEEMDRILKNERNKIKKSIENSKNLKEMPSKVSNIVMDYLKGKVK